MQEPIKKIILATDFSSVSKDASNRALFLARAYKAELMVLHVLDVNAWSFPSYYFFTVEGFDRLAESQEQVRQQGKDALKKLADSLDLDVETIFTEGDPGHEIVRVAEERKADLIVLGTHGFSGWKRFTIGSVAEFVGRHAPCAVFTIRSKGKYSTYVSSTDK
jgi:nucleotide-binding universal stress UspA family protein